MKKILTLTLLLITSIMLFAQEEDDFFSDDTSFEDMDFDEMFSDEDDFLEEVEDKSDEIAAPSAELLTTVGVEWGGSLSSSISAGFTYADQPEFSDLTDHEKYKETFSPDFSASLHFNARPTDDTRFFGKFTTEIPFYDSANVEVFSSSSDTEGPITEVQIPKIKVYELFTDFNYESKVFFRVGKQNAKWGVGYFFSPADLLSIEAIDPENPNADREGPIAIKMSMPFGLNNLSMFLTVPGTVFTADEPSISDLIFAPQFQMLIKDVEVSTGVFYQKDLSPRAMVTGSFSTNTNFGKFGFFGEGVGQYGSDKTFIKDDYTTEKIDDEFFFKGTVGFSWSKEILDNNFMLIGQYLYNGEGYENDSFLSDPVKQLPVYGMLINGQVLVSDIMERSKHYVSANLSISDLFKNEDLSFSTFTMISLGDMSGFVKPSISYSLFDDLSMSLGSTFNIGEQGDELFGDKFAIELTVNLGGGNF